MGKNRDGSYRCDDCPKGAPLGIRVTATPILDGGRGQSHWDVYCINGHKIHPEFGIQFIIAPGVR